MVIVVHKRVCRSRRIKINCNQELYFLVQKIIFCAFRKCFSVFFLISFCFDRNKEMTIEFFSLSSLCTLRSAVKKVEIVYVFLSFFLSFFLYLFIYFFIYLFLYLFSQRSFQRWMGLASTKYMASVSCHDSRIQAARKKERKKERKKWVSNEELPGKKAKKRF